MEDILQEVEPDASYEVISYKTSELPERYLPLIYSRWLRSLRYGNPLFKKIASHYYYKFYHDYLEKLLAKPDSLVMLAVLSDDKDIVLGFSVSREDVLDYIHVHSNNRMHGIATHLLPEKISVMTHITEDAGKVWPSNPKYKHWKFNPFA